MPSQLHEGELKTKHRFTDFLYWILVAAVPIAAAAIGIGGQSRAALLVYVVVLVLCLALIYRHFCTHCPHYHAGNKTVQCMFYWGMPKFFRQVSGPLSGKDKIITLTATLVLIAFPLYWLMNALGMLIIYVMALAVFGFSMRRNECGRCAYSNCPLNSVKEGTP